MVSVANDDSDENPYTFLVSGVGVSPEMAVQIGSLRPVTIPDGSGSYNFGGRKVGETHIVTFTIRNTGTAALSLGGSPRVAISGSSTMWVYTQPPSSVAANGSAIFKVAFKPTTVANYSATVSISNNDTDENPYNFSLSGSGTVPEIAVLDPQGASISDGDDSVYLGESTYGALNFPQIHQFTISNSGSATLELTGNPRVALSGINGGSFSITEQPAASIGPGGQTTFTIHFQATQSEMAYATVSIANDDANENPFTFDVTGDGEWSGFIIIGSTDR